jgi:hypothetical protein
VIVIVCHQRPQTANADTLNPNDVTFDGVTKTSLGSGGLPSGITEAQVCGLGGASFGDKAHNGTGYSATVKIASH